MSFPYRYVDTDAALRDLMEGLRGASLLAFDTEAASFHRYHNRIYLLQISSRSMTAVVDPLAVSAVPELGQLLADQQVEVVFHDADFDLRLLDREYGLRVRRVFDTRVAAQLLNEPGIGLAALLEAYLGIRQDKRYQRADWSRRPLEKGMLEYAAADTHHLPALRDLLRDKLVARGRLAWAEEEFAAIEEIRWNPPEDEGFWRLKGARLLKGPAAAVLRELYEWREALAQSMDRAPFRIMGNDVLLALATSPPGSREALRAVRGVPGDLAARRGAEIMDVITRGLAAKPADQPRLERKRGKAPEPEYFDRLDRLKQARNAAAIRVDLQPGVLCPNGTLEAVARATPATREDLLAVPELRRWQVDVMGEDLLKAVAGPGQA